MFRTTLVFVSCGIHFSNVFIVRWRVSLWRYAWQRCRITFPNIIHYVSIKWSSISHHKEPLTRSLRVLFVVSMKQTAENKQPSCRWFEMPWRSCDVIACLHVWSWIFRIQLVTPTIKKASKVQQGEAGDGKKSKACITKLMQAYILREQNL